MLVLHVCFEASGFNILPEYIWSIDCSQIDLCGHCIALAGLSTALKYEKEMSALLFLPTTSFRHHGLSSRSTVIHHRVQ